MKQFSFLVCVLIFSETAFSGKPKLISGPMQGNTTPHSMNVWLMVKNADSVSFSLKENASGIIYNQVVATQNIKGYKKYYPVTFRFTGLKEESEYAYEIRVDDMVVKGDQPFYTAKKELQDFSFLLGSCAYVPPVGLRFIHPGIEERVYRRKDLDL